MELEKIKLKIEMLKSFLLAFLTALFGVLAYSCVNLYSLKETQFALIIFGILLLSVAVAILTQLLFKEFKKLKDLK